MSASVTPVSGRVCSLTDIISNFAEEKDERGGGGGGGGWPPSHGPSYDRPTCDTTGINV